MKLKEEITLSANDILVVNDTEKESSQESTELSQSQRTLANQITIFKWGTWNFVIISW